MSEILNDLFGFFKHSTARRADVIEVRKDMAEQLGDDFDESFSQFFIRHVESRWLEMYNCLERLLSLGFNWLKIMKSLCSFKWLCVL